MDSQLPIIRRMNMPTVRSAASVYHRKMPRPSLWGRFKSRVENILVRGQVSLNSTAGWFIVSGTTPHDEAGDIGRRARLLGWERNAVVNACVRVVVETLASVPLEVYKPNVDGTSTVIQNHPASKLLQFPGGETGGLSSRRLITRSGVHFLLYGNALWYMERHGLGEPPFRIRVFSPEQLQHVWVNTDSEEIIAYDWRDLADKTHDRTPVTDIMHFRDLDATDGLFGYPRFAAALRAIITDGEASEYVRQVVTNHGVPSLAILTDGEQERTELDAAEERWREKYTEQGNRGATAFLAGVKNIKQIGFDLEQLEFPNLRAITREDICAAAMVDPRIIGLQSSADNAGLSGEQYREARIRLIQGTVIPVMRTFEDHLNHWFMPEFGTALVRFSPDVLAALTEDDNLTSQRITREVQSRLRTVEEGRRILGLSEKMVDNHTLYFTKGSSDVKVSDRYDVVATDVPSGVNGQPPSDANAQDKSNTNGKGQKKPKSAEK